MSKTPFMPLWVGDFLSDTTDLDAREVGAFLLLLMAMWGRNGTLPNDPRKLQRVARIERDWSKVWASIGRYFRVDGDQICNDRLDEELAKARAKSTVRIDAGARGGRAKALKDKEARLANAIAEPYQSESESESDKKEKSNPPIPPTPPDPPKAARKLACVHPEFDAEFQTIWKHYPRKVGLGAARKAWAKARKGTDFDTISRPLGRFIRAIRGTPTEKIPHLATWLNQERWNDDQSHAANRARTSTEDLDRLANVTSTEDLDRLFGAPQLRVISQ